MYWKYSSTSCLQFNCVEIQSVNDNCISGRMELYGIGHGIGTESTSSLTSHTDGPGSMQYEREGSKYRLTVLGAKVFLSMPTLSFKAEVCIAHQFSTFHPFYLPTAEGKTNSHAADISPSRVLST